MSQKWAKKIISLSLISAMLLTSCGTNYGSVENDSRLQEETVEIQSTQEPEVEADSAKSDRTGDTTDAATLAAEIREKYQDSDQYEYTDPVLNVKRDYTFVKQSEFDIMDGRFNEFTQLVEVYQDSALTQGVNAHYEWNKDTKELSILPPIIETGSVYASKLEKSTVGNDGSTMLFEKGELKDWGNLPEYYMVQYIDFATGEALEKPIVTVFTVQHELASAPTVKVTINEEGLPQFSWNRVENADTYYIVTIDATKENGMQGGGWVQGNTNGTTWTPEKATHLTTYQVSEAEREEESNVEKYGEGTSPILSDENSDEYYCVIAVSEDGTSAISNTVSKQELAHRVPYLEETVKNIEEGSNYVEDVLALAPYKWITMCDGKLVQRLVNYDYKNAKEVTKTWGFYEKEDMSDLHNEQVDLVEIPYTIDGTNFTGKGIVQKYNPDTLQEDLKALEARQENLRNKSGSTDLNVNIDSNEQADNTDAKPETDQNDSATDQVYKTDYKITANSALSEYLASNMLAGTGMISLASFPESSDQNLLMDSLQEAIYQNPLILGVSGVSISEDGTYIAIEYDTDTRTMQKKQEELVAEVNKVVGTIITDNMSDIEKEEAINQYLCDSAEYDVAALENAEKNEFVSVDPEFKDSFTPYGVLINKVGVCASYAGSFKILADAAGLDCITVTGYLDGETPHEWNKVKIDGEWQIVDSTNNDNEQLFNALFNLPDIAATKVLVEDSEYVLDKNLGDFMSSDTEHEYYRVSNKFYPEDTISDSIAEELMKNGSSTLRTDYDLNDEEFATICQAVMEKTGNESLLGYYWMGVIYLEEDK